MKKKKIIGIVLTLAGLCFIFNGVYTEGSRIHKQNELKAAFQNTLSEEGKTENNSDTLNQAVAQSVQAPEGEATAVISIPAIDLEVAMIEGIDMDKLTYAVEHFSETVGPGEKGNFAVAGHRNWMSGAFFARLDELKEGDKINVKTKDSFYTYTVSKSFVVNPDEVWVLDPSEESMITLVTCTIGGKQRLIVRGTLDSSANWNNK